MNAGNNPYFYVILLTSYFLPLTTCIHSKNSPQRFPNVLILLIFPNILNLYSKTAKEVCEGQQLDMDFEKLPIVSLDEYLKMIELKTSVLLAASLQMGAVIGGAGEGNRNHLYEFGKNLGIAFQIQDDYLD